MGLFGRVKAVSISNVVTHMQSEAWPQRPLLFAVLGAVFALAIHFLVTDLKLTDPGFNWRIALAVGVAAFGLGFAVCTHRRNIFSGAVFALFVAAIAGGTTYWRLYLDWSGWPSFLALAISLFIFAPFYQTILISHWRDYRALHQHAWGNTVVFALGGAFIPLSLGLAFLLAALFSIAGIDFLKELLREDLTRTLIMGVALGAAIGVLREHDSIIASTQALVQSVFSLLVVPLAVGLGVFLLALPFTGLEPLWSTKTSSTAILFSCAVGALIILNAAIREDDSTQSKNSLVLLASRVLAMTVAPLALISVYSLKLRIDQYGLTPDRLWAAVVCLLLVLYGLGYFLSALRRSRFFVWVRSYNLYMALVVSALAVLLATPLLDFGAVSARDQLARFENGITSEDDLDLTAFAFDFGPAGRKTLEDMRATTSTAVAARIDIVLDQDKRWNAARLEKQKNERDLKDIIKSIPSTRQIPDELLSVLRASVNCRDQYCYAVWPENDDTVLIVDQSCPLSGLCRPKVTLYIRNDFNWRRVFQHTKLPDGELGEEDDIAVYLEKLESAAIQGEIELRPVQRMQIFIGDSPIGPVVE